MKIFTIPNIITVFRIFLIPAYLYFFIQGAYGTSILIFALAGISDVVDGGIARYFKQQSLIGSILDPAADKILMLATYLTLGMTKHLPYWIMILVIGRDVWIVFWIFIFQGLKKEVKFHATTLSKLNTFLQLFTISWVFLKVYYESSKPIFLSVLAPILSVGLDYVLYFVAFTTVLSGIQYSRIGIKILKQGSDEFHKKEAV